MAAGGGAGGGYMGRGGGPDAGSMSANAFGGTSGKGKDVQEAKNQLMGVISVEEARRNPQNAIATPASPTGYVSKYGGWGTAKGIESSLIGAGVLDPKYGPTAPAVVVGGFDPGFGPHYDGPIKDISGANTSSPGKIAPFGIDTENINYNPWGVNPREAAPALKNQFAVDEQDVLEAIAAYGLENVYQGLNPQSTPVPAFTGFLQQALPVISMTYGMGQAAKNALIAAGFNVTEEGPSKKGQIPGQETDTTGSMLDFMDLNFQGMEGVSVDPIGDAVLDLSQSFASNYDNPAAYNQSVIDALGKASSNTDAISRAGGDPTLAVIQREIAQKAAEKLIAQEAARNNNIVNIPVAEGPPVNVKITKAPKRPKRGKEAANYIDPGPSPAQIAAASVVADQNKFKKLPKRIQQELRSGQQPTGSDYDVDRAMAIINPPKPYNPPSESHLQFRGGSGGGR